MEGVRVMGIDAQCSVQVLWQYFDDKGGVVKAIYYPLLNNDAVIIFKHPTGTTDVLSRNHEKWKVSPLPNQVFSRQRVWVESDLSMLVQATEAYQDSLRNMGQVDFIIDSNTHELILTGQPYQIEWAWNYLSTLRDNQFHIARLLQTGEVNTSALGLLHGSSNCAFSTAYELSHCHEAQSTRQSRDAKLQKDSIKNVTSLQLESLTNKCHESSPRSSDSYDDAPHGSARKQKLHNRDSLKYITSFNEEQSSRGNLGARERRRRQEDANETFNKFASLPQAPANNSTAAFRDPGHHLSGRKRDDFPVTLPSQELECLEAAHKLEQHFQSLDHKGVEDDYHFATGSHQSLQTDFARHKEDMEADDKRTKRTYRSERKTPFVGTSYGTTTDPSPYVLSAASAELSQKQFQIGKRLKLKVYMDDITKIKTDAVVNAANWELKNLGGVAGALARAAGPEMAAECCKLLQKHGALATAQVVKTKAYGKLGHLKCVIHTVGPIYIETDTERSVFELTQTFYNCLEFAEKLHLTSIAFPFISTGIFGMPVELCVLSLVSAVMLFSEQQRGTGSPVEEIHFINNDINVVCEAIIMIEQRLSMETMDSTRQRFEEGKKHYGRYVFPSYQSTSFQRSDSERYATWDSSQQRYAVDREDMDISQPGGRSDSHLLTGTGSLTQFGAKLDLRQRSGSLDRGCKTLPLDSISQRTAGSHPSPRPQARPRSNSMTLRGKTPSASSRASASSLTFHGGDCGRQPVIKKSLTGSSSKSTGLAKKVANKKSAQSAGEHLSSDTS
ncbi:uncharacterized protein LOC143297329 isoform X1 [Babylonia areolata]|uniref:uncharacterized protein LOC143297329 isoform X1 n=1 Tax=Babylonia areolata TaxID=304850 RepID=UPI003FD55D0D